MVTKCIYLAAIILTISDFAPNVADGVSTDINKRQAEILCSIYNAASNPPTETFNRQELGKITAEVDTINASIAPETWFDELERASKEPKSTEEFKKKYGVDEQGWVRWKEAVEKVREDKSPYPRLPVENPVTQLARIKLNKIENQATAILQDIQSKNEEAKLTEIKTKFDAAIGTPTADIFAADTRVSQCGLANGNKGAASGKNLVGDFICLCAYEVHTDGAGDACFGAAAPVGTVADTNFASYRRTLETIQAMWGVVEKECGKQEHPKTTDTRFMRQVLADFFRELDEAETGDKSRKPGTLGSLDDTGATGCDGQFTGRGGPCVIYTKSTGKRDYQIGWRAPLEVGLKQLEIAEDKSASIQRDIVHLKTLLSRAQQIYEETKAAVELEKTYTKRDQNQSQSRNPTTQNDKATAQEPTAVSIASVSRFTLTWLLLI